MPFCPICERTFPTKNGLQGHFRFKHRYEMKQRRPAQESPFIDAIGRNIERRMSGDAIMKAMEEKESRKDAWELEEKEEDKEGDNYVERINGLEDKEGGNYVKRINAFW